MLWTMRTTLEIDDDVLLAAKSLAVQRRTSAGRVLSELARNALTPRKTLAMRNGVPLFPVKPGAKVVTMELVNRLRDEAP
jgi:hypothetical protein